MKKAARERPEVRVVDDEILAPTSTVEIATATINLLKADARGLFHVTAEGQCSWFEFASVIFDTLHLTTPLAPAKSREFPSSVRRPPYSVLENRRLHSLGLPSLRHWRDALIHFLLSADSNS
jgi:dTDP-4-dehydrorhamnose reductase